MIKITGVTTKIIATAIMLARKGNNVIICTSNCENVKQHLIRDLSRYPATETTDCNIGWIEVVTDVKMILSRSITGIRNLTMIVDNYCINIKLNELDNLRKYVKTLFTYDQIMEQNFEWIKLED